MTSFDHFLRKLVLENVKYGINKFFIGINRCGSIAFKDTVYIFDYEIHLKYCQDTEGY